MSIHVSEKLSFRKKDLEALFTASETLLSQTETFSASLSDYLTCQSSFSAEKKEHRAQKVISLVLFQELCHTYNKKLEKMSKELEAAYSFFEQAFFSFQDSNPINFIFDFVTDEKKALLCNFHSETSFRNSVLLMYSSLMKHFCSLTRNYLLKNYGAAQDEVKKVTLYATQVKQILSVTTSVALNFSPYSQ